MRKTEYVGIAALRILAINAVLWAAVILICWLALKVAKAVLL